MPCMYFGKITLQGYKAYIAYLFTHSLITYTFLHFYIAAPSEGENSAGIRNTFKQGIDCRVGPFKVIAYA